MDKKDKDSFITVDPVPTMQRRETIAGTRP